MPQIEALHDQFAAEDLKIELLSLDFEDQIGSKLLPFIEENKMRSKVSFLNAGDPNKWIDMVEPAWSGAIPFTLILDPTRQIRWYHEGELDEGTLKTILVEQFNLKTK